MRRGDSGGGEVGSHPFGGDKTRHRVPAPKTPRGRRQHWESPHFLV